MPFAAPRPVTEGSRLAIVAPAGPFDEEAFRCGVSWLRQFYRVDHSPEIFSKEGFLAGSDERRLHELTSAIANPEIDAILCARGGYGATRLLPGVDLAAIRAANKLLVGFSDITALHALWANAGVYSLHAPMVASLGNASDEVQRLWKNAIEGPGSSRGWQLSRLNPDSPNSSGRFMGGNLAVLTALNGTAYGPPLDDAILFVEDVGERPYRVDRMLTTLSQSGWFDRINGLVIGAFTDGDPGPDGVSLDEVFARWFSSATFPVLKGLPAGHVSHNEPLPFGGLAVIDGNTLTINAQAST
ncbi:MAG: LD-carboxypeptidase [Verrucomicrobiota bacterium]